MYVFFLSFMHGLKCLSARFNKVRMSISEQILDQFSPLSLSRALTECHISLKNGHYFSFEDLNGP